MLPGGPQQLQPQCSLAAGSALGHWQQLCNSLTGWKNEGSRDSEQTAPSLQLLLSSAAAFEPHGLQST